MAALDTLKPMARDFILQILDDELPEEIGVARTMDWLNQNQSKLESFPSALTVEILVGLKLEDACRFIRIPAEAIEALFELQCDLLFQYSRELPGQTQTSPS